MKLFHRGSLIADSSLELQGLGLPQVFRDLCSGKDSALYCVLWVLESVVLEISAVLDNSKVSVGKYCVFFDTHMWLTESHE